MTGLFVLLAALVILGAALALTGRWTVGVTSGDRPAAPALPDVGEWDAAALSRTRFRVALRGYRMQDVDAMMASLAAQLRQSEANAAGGRDIPAADTPTTDPPATDAPTAAATTVAPTTARSGETAASPPETKPE